VSGALTIYRREIAETKRINTALHKEKAQLQERMQREIATSRVDPRRARQDLAKGKADPLQAQKLFLLDQKQLARNWEDFNNQQERRNNEETTTTRLDVDTDTDSFCDSEGHYRPELEEAHDRQQRAEFNASGNDLELASPSKSPPRPRNGSGTPVDRHQTLDCNDGTVLTRSPCALGEDWVRCRCENGITGERCDDDEEGDKCKRAEATKGKNKKAEATKGKGKKAEAKSPHERAKKKFEKKNKQEAAEEGTTTTHKTGTRIQCLGCGEVLTILPSRVFPEHCEPCTEWHYEVCDKFVDLESSAEGNKEDTERQLADLWKRQGGDPFYLQETKEKWEEGARSSSSSSSSSSPSSSSSSTNKKAKKEKKKRKKQREVATVKEESGDDDGDNDDDEEGDIDPRQLGWEEHARRGRIEGNATLPARGRPRARSKKQ
jgi:hypothetical protein